MYHSLPISYAELLLVLIQNYMISVILAKPRKPQFPKEYDFNAKCEYHGGVIRHSIENCTTFKDKVQALIDADLGQIQSAASGHRGH